VISFTPRPLYPLGNSPRYPLDNEAVLSGHEQLGASQEKPVTTVC